MKWEEIREKYPDQWVFLKVLKYHLVERGGRIIAVVDDFQFISTLEKASKYVVGIPFWTHFTAAEMPVTHKKLPQEAGKLICPQCGEYTDILQEHCVCIYCEKEYWK